MAKYLDGTGLAQLWTACKNNFLTTSGGDSRYLRYYNNATTNPDIDSLNDTPYLLTVAASGSYGYGTKPSGTHNGFGVFNVHTHVGNYYTQLGLDTNQNYLWIRSVNDSSTYGSWQRLAMASEIPTSISWSSITSKPLSGDSGNNGPVWGNYVPVKSDGVMEIGKYLDFHNSSNDGVDYAVRLMCQGDNRIQVNLPTSGGTLALTSQIPTNTNQLTNGAGYITSSGSCNYATSAGSATYASSYLANRQSIGTSSQNHAQALQSYFDSYKSSIPRNCLTANYSGSYGNGSLYFGYFLSGYDSTPYGGFYVCHYDTPYYVGITNGSYSQQQIITSSSIGSQSVNYASSAGSVAWGNVSGKPSTFTPSSHTHDYLPLSGGQMTGPLTWSGTGALPERSSVDYVLTIDAFANGGKTYWASTSTLKTSLGLGTAAAKDSTTTVSSGNGSLITSGAVYDYIETYIAPTRYETVTVTCVTDESGVSMYGGTITIDEVTYTIPSDGIVTAQITDGRTYSIIPGQKSGYVAPADQTITAVNGRTRNLTLIWTKMVYGVYILYSDLSLSNYNQLVSYKTPEGVVLYNSSVNFVIHPTQGTGTWGKYNYSSNTSPVHSYGYSSSSTTNPSGYQNDYGGKRNTTSSNSSRRGTAFSGAIGVTWGNGTLSGYLPACGEMEQIRANVTNINAAMELIGGTKLDFSKAYWTSTQLSTYYSGTGNRYYFGVYWSGSSWTGDKGRNDQNNWRSVSTY